MSLLRPEVKGGLQCPIGLTVPYLRWQLDEVVKVSLSFGALNILDIAWKAGIVGLVVNFLNLGRIRVNKCCMAKSPAPANVLGMVQTLGCTVAPC